MEGAGGLEGTVGRVGVVMSYPRFWPLYLSAFLPLSPFLLAVAQCICIRKQALHFRACFNIHQETSTCAKCIRSVSGRNLYSLMKEMYLSKCSLSSRLSRDMFCRIPSSSERSTPKRLAPAMNRNTQKTCTLCKRECPGTRQSGLGWGMDQWMNQ